MVYASLLPWLPGQDQGLPMQVGDRVICKLGFWNGPSSASEKIVYEVVNDTDLSSEGQGDLTRLDLRGPNGLVLEGCPENHYEPVQTDGTSI